MVKVNTSLAMQDGWCNEVPINSLTGESIIFFRGFVDFGGPNNRVVTHKDWVIFSDDVGEAKFIIHAQAFSAGMDLWYEHNDNHLRDIRVDSQITSIENNTMINIESTYILDDDAQNVNRGRVTVFIIAHVKPELGSLAEIAYASWIHGSAMQIERPESLNTVIRRGQGIHVEGYTSSDNVFHFLIPTPVIINDDRLRIGSAMLKFTTSSPEAVVKHVFINDGSTQIQAFNNVNLSGNVGLSRFDFPIGGPQGHTYGPQVWLGIDIVVYAQFGVYGWPPKPLAMDFEAAGCDFYPSRGHKY